MILYPLEGIVRPRLESPLLREVPNYLVAGRLRGHPLLGARYERYWDGEYASIVQVEFLQDSLTTIRQNNFPIVFFRNSGGVSELITDRSIEKIIKEHPLSIPRKLIEMYNLAAEIHAELVEKLGVK